MQENQENNVTGENSDKQLQHQMSDVAELRDLGMESAASQLEARRKLARKLAIAYENFRFVTPENISAFNKKLMDNTRRDGKQPGYFSYDTLSFINLKDYSEVPPRNVLEDLRQAKSLGCFDYYEVAKIASVEVRPDPILFGVITGCRNKFAVSQWDNDVRVEDLLSPDEG